jgi:PAS domain S-box-containing protein
MEKKLRESEEWLSTTLQSIGDAVIAADTDGTITFINKAAEHLTGFAREEACGKKVEEVLRLVDQQTRAVVESLTRASLMNGSIVTLKEPLILVARDGREIPVDDSAAPIKDENGKVQGAVVVFHDFTERKRMEDELRQTNTFLRGILESSSSISITSTTLDGTIQYWNSGAERLFGYSAVEIVGRQNIRILYPDDEPETTAAISEIKHSVFTEKKSVHREVKEITRDGRKLWISLTASPQLDDHGNVVGALGIGEDISERKRAEEDRARLIKDLQEALANVKTLSGLLPICASCKKVRDDKGYWNQIEAYIQEHSDASFSHSICPECMEKYYGDILHKKP